MRAEVKNQYLGTLKSAVRTHRVIMKKWMKWIGILLAALVSLAVLAAAGAVLGSLGLYQRSWDEPRWNQAGREVRASSDPAVIARGRYLVYASAHCADCHTPDASREAMFRGEEVPLTGGTGEVTYLGSWTAPNLTSDTVTGIGKMSDAQFARLIRHGINRENRIALPFKDAYADLAEEDLVAILSYLRTLPPAPGVGPRKEINLFGKITLAYFLTPYKPEGMPRARFEPEASAAYGDYLANTVGRCESCHTPRNLKTGEFLGAPLSGGMPFKSRLQPGMMFVAPNLTPDSATGHIAGWSEEFFVRRMQAGAVFPDSPMPWGSYRRMTDTDLRALYRYLRSLKPVRHEVGAPLQPEKA
ncbi:MAG: cytochrome [Fibrobacteria bacterium]|jgi:mono/diheme cytochrome c family protein|nr:cytochrome [Fibrobacteria bacterium]